MPDNKMVLTQARGQVDAEEYRLACARFATGVAVASVMQAEGTPAGLTISSFTSASMEPRLILFCVHRNSHVLPHFRQSYGFGVNILSARQIDLSSHFARRPSGPAPLVRWQYGGTGVPLLEGASAALECRLHDLMPCGDHEILVGEVRALSIGESAPLVRCGGMYRSLEGLNAVSYQGISPKSGSAHG
jgi:flavin reductase (DIM6/NTAB) family NADH-FMN oxidoreductase RutF